jgi:hypothetical protein
MNKKEKTGKIKFICITSLFLLSQISIFSVYVWRIGTDRIDSQFIRLFITILLVIGTYRGLKFARLLFVAYLLFNALGAIFISNKFSDNSSLIVGVIFYFSLALYLKFSEDISEFIQFKNNSR